MVAERRDNNINLIRLVLASLVIVTHAYEIKDGVPARDPFIRLFGTNLGLSDLAVDGFFLLSGYLVTKSYQSSQGTMDYLLRRIRRICPGFLAAFLVSVATAWIAVGKLLPVRWTDIVTLGEPIVAGAWPGTYLHTANSSLWTIRYEAMCYLLLGAIGWFGWIKRRNRVACLTAIVWVAAGVVETMWQMTPHLFDASVSSLARGLVLLEHFLRFTTYFFAGCSFFLFKDRIRFTRRLAVAASIALLPMLFGRASLSLALPILGGYLLFAFASARSRLPNLPDASYGMYLYAWPIQKAFYWNWPNMTAETAIVCTLVTAYGVGWASQILIERPFLVRRQKRAGALVTQNA